MRDAGIEQIVISLGSARGAGDSLVAGLVWGLSSVLALAATLQWGVACGTAAASHSGTAFGSYAEVMRLAERVKVREMYHAEHA